MSFNPGNNIEDVYNLSPLQEGFLYHYLYDKGTNLYQEQFSCRVTGLLQPALVSQSFDALIRRHPILRTAFVYDKVEQPLQVVLRERTLTVHYEDASGRPDAQAAVAQYLAADQQRRFSLAGDMLLRVALFKVAADEHLVLISWHHIIMEAWSVGLLLREFFDLYSHYALDTPLQLGEAGQYCDYIKWLNNQEPHKAKSFWKQYLAGYHQPLEIPGRQYALAPPGENAKPENFILHELDGTTTAAVVALAAALQVTPSTFFHVVWGMLLAKYNNTTDAVFGSVRYTRPQEVNENTLGLFINTVPVRVCYNTHTRLDELLGVVQQQLGESEQHHYLALSEVQAGTGLNQQLFHSLFVFQNDPFAGPGSFNGYHELLSLRVSDIRLSDSINYDLFFEVSSQETFTLRAGYNPLAYEEPLIAAVVSDYVQLVRQAVAGSEENVDRIALQGFAGNVLSNPRALPGPETVVTRVEAQATESPDRHAVHFADHWITYRELNERSNRLAHYLIDEIGLRVEELVGIHLHRSEQVVIAALAVLKAGGCLVPVDVMLPPEKKQQILEEAGCRVVLSRADHFAGLSAITGALLLDTDQTGSHKITNPPARAAAGNLMYVVFSSGTTGRPKGIMVEHGSMLNMLTWYDALLDLRTNRNILQVTNFSVDIGILEIFSTLMYGGCLHLVEEALIFNAGQMREFLRRHRINVIQVIPDMLKEYFREGPVLEDLHYILCGGDHLPEPLKNEILDQGYTLYNIYGQTETTIDALLTLCRPGQPALDQVVQNYEVFILANGRIAPDGVTGEIVIGGIGLARGYLNNPALTHEKFVVHPLDAEKRVYKTGDLGKKINHTIVLAGRDDHQIKIRGYSVNLKYVEEVVSTHEAVLHAAVALKSETDKQLVAYLVCSRPVTPLEMRSYLKALVPDYMVPSYLVTTLEKLPLTPGGKVDYRALPDPVALLPRESTGAAGSDTERKLLDIWSDVLGVAKVSAADNYFVLGGDSIKAIRILSAINKTFHTSFEVNDVYAFPTVEAFAAFLENEALSARRSKGLQEAAQRVEAVKQAILQDPAKRELLPVGWEDFFPLSDIELGMVYHSGLQDAHVYHSLDYYEFEDEHFSFPALRQAFSLLVERHPMLRTSFHLHGFDPPIQVVHPHEGYTFDIPFFDLSGRPAAEQEALIREQYALDLNAPFALDVPKLWRLTLFKVSPHTFVLLWSVHHAILDGWSNASLKAEFFNTYHDLKSRKKLVTKPLKATYKDFIVFQDYYKNLPLVREFWRRELASFVETDLPFNRKPRYDGDRALRLFHLEGELTAQITSRANALSLSLRDLLLAAYVYTVKLTTNAFDVTVGNVSHGRPEIEDGDKIIGCFLNTIPFRYQFTGRPTYQEYILAISNKALQLKKYDKLTLFEIAKAAGHRGSTVNPFFNTFFDFTDFHVGRQQKHYRASRDLVLDNFEVTNTLLDFDVNKHEEHIAIAVTYQQDLYPGGEIDRFMGYYVNFLNRLIQHPAQLIDDRHLMGDEEVERVLDRLSNQAGLPGDHPTFLGYFAAAAARHPGKVAVSCNGVQLTYCALDEYSDRLAGRLLADFAVTGEDIIALAMERSEKFLLLLLAIQKAGAAYLPIDPALPAGRCGEILADANVRLVITDAGLPIAGHAAGAGAPVLAYDALFSPAGEPREPAGEWRSILAGQQPLSQQLAYVIYTSGSTGRPKGVAIEHRGMLNHLRAKISDLALGPQSIIAQNAHQGFDVSVWQFLAALLVGGTTVVYDRNLLLDPAAFLARLDADGVTVLEVVPSYLGALLLVTEQQALPCTLDTLRHLLVTGEAVTGELLKKWYHRFPAAGVVNAYGPTEASDDITHCVVDPNGLDAEIPVGRPVLNTNIYVLSEDGQLCPPEVKGEIYASGTGVGRGYLNDPEKTAAVFMADPFRPGLRMYKTGDTGRYSTDGTLFFYGRTDTQVKIRGHRIELGEIEQKLCAIPGVEAAIAREFTVDGAKVIAAFVVAAPAHTDAAALRLQLKAHLPGYMVPDYLELRDQLPLLPSGKVDRTALTLRDADRCRTGAAPGTATEIQLAALWAELLNWENISKTDHFFEIGGHSLNAFQLITRVTKMLGVKIEIRDVFANPTVEQLARLIDQSNKVGYQEIEPVAPADDYALSHAQQRLWVIDQLTGEGGAYNIPQALEIRGDIRPELLERAVVQLLERHEILRTSIVMVNNTPRQRVIAPGSVAFRLEVAQSAHDIASEATMHEVNWFVTSRFDLSEGPLLRVKLITFTPEHSLLLFVIHHIVSDAWSAQTWVHELMSFYKSGRDQAPYLPRPLRVHYKDFAAWHNQRIASGGFAASRAYWQGKLAEAPPVLELPADYPRPAQKSFQGKTLFFEIDASLTAAVRAFAKKHEASTFMFFLAAVKALFFKYTNQTDITIGSTVAGRTHPDLENQIGFYVNLLALRTVFDRTDTFAGLLGRVKQDTLDALEHQAYPFDLLVDELRLKRDLSRSPLFDVLIEYQAADLNLAELSANGTVAGVSVTPFAIPDSASKYDLTFFITDEAATIQLAIEYDKNLFKGTRVESLFRHLGELLSAVTQSPDQPLYALNILPRDERQRLLQYACGAEQDDLAAVDFVTQFEHHSRTHPHRPALTGGGAPVSYGVLNDQANRLAHTLRERFSVGPHDRVAVLTERSGDFVCAMLAVFKAGAVFIPLDVEAPAGRQQFVLEDAAPKLLITESRFFLQVSQFYAGSVLAIDIEADSLENLTADPARPGSDGRLAYVIYTSGSTGTPKGVEIGLESLSNYVNWARPYYYPDNRPQVVPLFTSVAFDLTLTCLTTTLAGGHCLQVYSSGTVHDHLLDIFGPNSPVTTVKLTPSHVTLMAGLGIAATRVEAVIVGGEKLEDHHVAYLYSLNPHLRVYNEYGPTEATIGCTVSHINRHEAVTIGRPISNCRVYVLDTFLNLCPENVPGELYISGTPLAAGYAGSAELTAARFVANPHADSVKYGRMYYSGDRAQWTEQGRLMYLGRRDEQLKINGFRVEPAEIENVLLRQEGIKAVKVLQKNQELVAYLTADQPVAPGASRDFLREYLPQYMIPRHYVLLDHFPLTRNGKIDAGALPDPLEAARPEEGLVPPQGEIEEKLTRTWEEVLGRGPVGVTQNFFDLGGNSLKVVAVVSAFNEQYQDGLKVVDLFNFGTVRELAAVVQERLDLAVTPEEIEQFEI